MAQRLKIEFIGIPAIGPLFRFDVIDAPNYNRTYNYSFSNTNGTGTFGVLSTVAQTADNFYNVLLIGFYLNGVGMGDNVVSFSKTGNIIYVNLSTDTAIFDPSTLQGIPSGLEFTIETISFLPNIQIIYQNANGSINAAYRPIIFRCSVKDIRSVVLSENIYFIVGKIHFENYHEFFVPNRTFEIINYTISGNNKTYTVISVEPDANPPGWFVTVAESFTSGSGQTATIISEKYLCPMVYCDIYLNGIYYKSLSKTQFTLDDGVFPQYDFDIQDAIQEVMGFNLPQMDGSDILDLEESVKMVFVKIRNAILDSDGFITSVQAAPIQANSSSQSIPGEGVQSNEIYVYNATLQHEDSQNLATFLSGYKTGVWSADSYPLTKRPKVVKLCKNDSSYFPIISASTPEKICLTYKIGGVSSTVCVPVELKDCPYVDYPTNFSTNNADGTQTFSFTWDAVSGAVIPDFITVDYQPIDWDPIANGPYGSVTTALIQPLEITLPLGLFNFIFAYNGSCRPVVIPSSLQNIGIEPSPTSPYGYITWHAIPPEPTQEDPYGDREGDLIYIRILSDAVVGGAQYNPITDLVFQTNNGNGWIDEPTPVVYSTALGVNPGLNQFRQKGKNADGVEVYSINVLQYTRT